MRCPTCATDHPTALVACPQCGRPLLATAPTVAAPPPRAGGSSLAGASSRPDGALSAARTARPGGPPSVALPDADLHAAPPGALAAADPLPGSYLDRPPLLARAERFAPVEEAAAEVAPPPTRPAVVGTWHGRAHAPPPSRRVWLAGGAGVTLVAALVAAAIGLSRRAADPPAGPRTARPGLPPPAIETVAAQAPDEPQWDGAPLLVTIETTPRAAAVRFDGQRVAGNQVEVRRDGRTHTVVVSAPGHVTQAQAFIPQQTGKLRVVLRRAAAR